MNWLKAIGYGIALFAINFVIGSILMFGLKLSGLSFSIVMLIAAIVVLWLLANQYKIKALNDGIMVGLVWLVVDVILEYYVIVQIFSKGDAASFYNLSVLLGYALVVAVPAVVGAKARK
jgi:hypothetical protein